MINFVAAAAVAAVTIKQLVQARDGNTDQLLSDAFDPDDQPILEAVSARLEGKTVRQRNPHPRGTLAFAAWVIARLGGWTGYYGKPGPKVMRIGLADFPARGEREHYRPSFRRSAATNRSTSASSL